MVIKVGQAYVDRKTKARAIVWAIPFKKKIRKVHFQYTDGEERGVYHTVTASQFKAIFTEITTEE